MKHKRTHAGQRTNAYIASTHAQSRGAHTRETSSAAQESRWRRARAGEQSEGEKVPSNGYDSPRTRTYTHNTHQHTNIHKHTKHADVYTHKHKHTQNDAARYGGRGSTPSGSGLVGVGVGGECRVRVGSSSVGGNVGGRIGGAAGAAGTPARTLTHLLWTLSPWCIRSCPYTAPAAAAAFCRMNQAVLLLPPQTMATLPLPSMMPSSGRLAFAGEP